MKSDIMYIGVDVSKKRLDVFMPANEKSHQPQSITLANDTTGYRELRRLARKHRATVCCEPTAGFEYPLIAFMHAAKVPIAYTPGYRVRSFAKSIGELHKNDKIDARMISRYAEMANPTPLEEKDHNQIHLAKQWSRYKTYLGIHVLFAQKLSMEHDPAIRKSFLKESDRMHDKANAILEGCIAIAREDSRMGYLLERFTAIDGVSDKTAISVIAGIPEIGKIKNEALAKLVGVAPVQNQSGSHDGIRRIHGGRREVRSSLYMASITVVQFNHVLSEYYRRKLKDIPGPRARKWALVPVMRKLLFLMNRLARDPNFELQKKPTIKSA